MSIETSNGAFLAHHEYILMLRRKPSSGLKGQRASPVSVAAHWKSNAWEHAGPQQYDICVYTHVACLMLSLIKSLAACVAVCRGGSVNLPTQLA